MGDGGSLADIYFLFKLLGMPFTIENVIIYIGICVFIVGVVLLCIASNS